MQFNIRKRCQKVVSSSLKAKDKIIDQSNITKLLEKQMGLLQKNIELAMLTGKRPEPQQLTNAQEKPTVALPKGKEIDVTPNKGEPEKNGK